MATQWCHESVSVCQISNDVKHLCVQEYFSHQRARPKL